MLPLDVRSNGGVSPVVPDFATRWQFQIHLEKKNWIFIFKKVGGGFRRECRRYTSGGHAGGLSCLNRFLRWQEFEIF